MNVAIAQLADRALAFTAHRPTPRSSEGTAEATQTQPPPVRGWSEVTDELLRLRLLEDDWDGQGAEAPAPGAVDSALKLAVELRLSGMPPADRVLAGVNGTIFFEWHDPAEYLEIEVVAPERAEGRWVDTDTNEVDEFTLTR